MSELKSRIRELETEQRLIQRELDSVSSAAQRAESQLRHVLFVFLDKHDFASKVQKCCNICKPWPGHIYE